MLLSEFFLPHSSQLRWLAFKRMAHITIVLFVCHSAFQMELVVNFVFAKHQEFRQRLDKYANTRHHLAKQSTNRSDSVDLRTLHTRRVPNWLCLRLSRHGSSTKCNISSPIPSFADFYPYCKTSVIMPSTGSVITFVTKWGVPPIISTSILPMTFHRIAKASMAALVCPCCYKLPSNASILSLLSFWLFGSASCAFSATDPP